MPLSLVLIIFPASCHTFFFFYQKKVLTIFNEWLTGQISYCFQNCRARQTGEGFFTRRTCSMWQRIHFPWVTEQGNIQHNPESGRRTEAINQFYNMTRIHRVWERIFIRTAQAAKYDHMISAKSVYCLKSYIVCWIWRLRKNTQDWEQRIQKNQDNIAKCCRFETI